MKFSRFIGKAGYHLSTSIILDTVMLHTIRHDPFFKVSQEKVFYINDLLYNLDLPLLMTREKLSKKPTNQRS